MYTYGQAPHNWLGRVLAAGTELRPWPSSSCALRPFWRWLAHGTSRRVACGCRRNIHLLDPAGGPLVHRLLRAARPRHRPCHLAQKTT